MIKVLTLWNVVVTVVLAVVLFSMFSAHKEPEVKAAEATQIVRASRLEITDDTGKTKAILEIDKSGSSNPKLTLFNGEGREAVSLSVNSKGYGTMYFQNKQTEGKVSVGYLWGSDSPGQSEVDDPLSSWGIRVRGGNGIQSNFGLLNNGAPIPTNKAAHGFQK